MRNLGSPVPARRAAAFRRLYAAGERLARRAAERLGADPVLRRLILSRENPLEAVGVAVRPGAYRRIRALWAVERETPVPAARRTREFSIDVKGRRLDVLTPAGADGPIAGFLAKHGEGIQQVELGVRDAGAAAERLGSLRDARLRGIGSRPARGGGGKRVYFVLVDISAKTRKRRVLAELVQKPFLSRER